MRKCTPIYLFIACIMLLLPHVSLAQETATVPDVLGMNVPQATALLNRSGIAVGAEIYEAWTSTSAYPENTIGAQSVAAGQTVERGSSIDLTILSAPNTLAIYDDNDLTLVNQSTGTLDLTGVRFNSSNGAASFLARRWGGTLAGGDCGQVWSVARREPKRLDECGSTLWLTTNDPAEHFWTGAGGVTEFIIAQNSIPRATCPVSATGRCQFYLATSGGSAGVDITYVYFAYTTDRLVIINKSDDKWLTLSGFVIHNNLGTPQGVPVNVADVSIYGNQQIIGNVQRLAPGQCLYFTNSGPNPDTPPEACDLIARLDIDPSVIFWGAPFDIESITDDKAHSCPAATPGRLTLCIMPR